ncbi:MAG: HD-GYP domain-containing protein [Proteobacteria bacterium]|nr:HD-GYP domain-containing protein [Pseudomonadota bacterium]
MKKRVPVGDLDFGMFVAELDRPWLDSPFLFQGFVVEGTEELETLREVCDFVYVDTARSLAFLPEMRGAPASAVAPEKLPARLRESALAARANDPQRFARHYQEVIGLQKRAHLALVRLLDERRLGKLVHVEEIIEVVNDLTESILRNPNVALWLTKMREQDELNAAHSINTCILAVTFGRHLGLTRDVLEAIGLGAMLHDIGLNDPANDIIRSKIRLDEEDFKAVRRHPLDGMFSLKRLDDLPRITRDIIRWHHERIDGSGYPHGLKGEEIPQYVRIAGIADVYDAMTSDRAYRQAMQPPDALAEMSRDADSTFGKELVRSFIHCVGIYPVGSVVKLNNGAIAMVASTFPGVRLSPLVLVLKDSAGRHMSPRRMINLASMQENGKQTWSIDTAVDPVKHGINITSIAVDELRAFG